MSAPLILLIEDCPDDAALIVEALARVVPRERIGLCTDGAAALDFFGCCGDYAGRDAAELPVFVLLDLVLPCVGGLDVLRAIRGQPRSRLLPVTILSASEKQEDVCAAAQLGANSFVRKPTDPQQFIDTLSRLARYWLELNIPPPCGAGF